MKDDSAAAAEDNQGQMDDSCATTDGGNIEEESPPSPELSTSPAKQAPMSFAPLSAEPEGGGWKCKRCTLVNDASTDKCPPAARLDCH